MSGAFKVTGIAQSILSLDVDPVPGISGPCWLMLAENIGHYAKKSAEYTVLIFIVCFSWGQMA